jgi:hemolysin III
MIKRNQTIGEEIANAITHGVGVILGISGLVVLLWLAITQGTVQHVVGFSIFGAAMIILYLASTLYHSLAYTRAKNLFRKFDHMAIFILIAGTYTPFCLTVLSGWIGWTLLGVIWGFAIIGIVTKVFFTGKNEKLSTFLYVGMGWAALLAIKPLYDQLDFTSFVLLITGGVFYTLGTIFFAKDHIKYFHSVWHIFVLAGTSAHFFALMSLVP